MIPLTIAHARGYAAASPSVTRPAATRQAHRSQARARGVSVRATNNAKLPASGIKELHADDSEAFLSDPEPQLRIVDFSTVWCGPCKIVAQNLENMSVQLNNIGIAKLDCELPENEKLASSLNVHELPTLVMYKNGKELKRFSGVRSVDQVLGELSLGSA